MKFSVSPQKGWYRYVLIMAGVLIFGLGVVYMRLIAKSGLALAACVSGGSDSVKSMSALCDEQLNVPVDSILVIKHARQMYVYHQSRLLKVYKIALGNNPVGPKHFQGDRKTPEGLYYINGKNANSMAHKSIGISYPNDDDRSYARSKRLPTGGDVEIHGFLNSWDNNKAYLNTDWTWGCIAVANDDIDELFKYVAMGTPINIVP